ncbi:Sushi, nidogen and EGF-like domain-containing protein 1,Alpha-tectorin [Mytilus coruscus]|uniref:Sushi, nidogen and EGF-like domain-containing protein 1,Alpha-tectorin n=1 Tax=Mytilus coruscus TaxID=42192 RepID=A0A6J8DJS5_MYTCO|nr:Sushi, nidogen and EGF-like domain-containing protein 1,Alpha-tectorin [Mytilus coruscus]
MNGARRLRLLQQDALMEMEEEDLLFANYYLNRWALRPERKPLLRGFFGREVEAEAAVELEAVGVVLVAVEVEMLPIIYLLFSKTVFGSVPISEFFSFGQSVNDAMLYPNDDGSSPVQNMSMVFEFFSEHRKQLFVNTNGLISFFKAVRTYTSEEFPKIGKRIVLAPFWADIDTRGCGSTCGIWYRESTELVDLSKATSEIRYFFPVMKNFNASWTYIVTWYNVPFYGATPLGMNKRNTFQAVLITDSKNAMVIYNYNKIEWTTGTASHGNASIELGGIPNGDIGLGGIPAQVGFNMGDEIHYYSVEGSRKSEIINLPNLSNVKYPGKFVFSVDLRDIEPAPTPDTDQCFLKAADIAFVVDLSLSIDIYDLKDLISDVISKLPINAMECQIALKSFSTSAKTEFRFKDHKTKTEILSHIAKMNTAKGVSNLKDALSSTTQMFSYNDGSRLYAKRFVIIFTDGLMVASSELKTQVDHLLGFLNMKVATVGIGSSVKHVHLERISTDINSILPPSATSIWKYLQTALAVPGCLACEVDFGGEIRILLENSGSITRELFKEGRQFIYTFVEELTSFNLTSVDLSVDIFNEEVIEAIPLQNISGMERKLGRLSLIEYSRNNDNQSLLLQHIKDIGMTSSSNSFIIFISNGVFLDSHFIEKLKHSVVNETSIIVSVGLSVDTNWDNLEDLATYGYFVFSSEDAILLARHLKKEMKTTTCT